MKIKYYRVEISDDKGIIKNRNTFEVKEHDCIGENDIYIVIDDIVFTTIEKTSSSKYKVYDVLGKPSICVNVSDQLYGNGVTYRLYSTLDKKPETIRKEIKAAIQKKIGFFLNDVDLSFIK